MAQFDRIVYSTKQAWNAGGNAASIPLSSIYYDRAQQPSGLSAFPYMRIFITEDEPEVTTQPGGTKIVHYHLIIQIWSIQGMSGSSGDQMTDQGNLMRALEATLSKIPPNTPWYSLQGFLHMLEGPSSLVKDTELYQGMDVMVSENHWDLMVQE